MESSSLSKEHINRLRIILEREHNRIVSMKEAEEIGRGLISLFESLIDNKLGYGRKNR